MATDISTTRKYYSMRGAALEQGDYYTTIKNQTFQQNSFFIYSAPRCLLNCHSDGSVGSLVINSTVYLQDGIGQFILSANNESMVNGTWHLSFNGGSTITNSSGSVWLIQHDDYVGSMTLTAGYNTIAGSFVPDASDAFAVSIYWENGWEA